MPIGVEMLIAWGSNFKHDKGSVHSSDLEILLQLHNLNVKCSTKEEFDNAVWDFLVIYIKI